jgi:Secretion system C-terminal sorting domain/TonB-dependent Receptor Plug Domain
MKLFLLLVLIVASTAKGIGQVSLTKAPEKLQILSKGTPDPSTQIFIRCGMSKSYADTPLYIIDGIPVEYKIFKQINPNEIECIDILKTSLAEVLYGCMAAKGVVIITTKQGLLTKIEVKDSKTHIGIPNATIVLKKKKATVHETKVTNEFGQLTYKIYGANIDSVIISSIGYEDLRISFRHLKTSKFKLFLTPKSQLLSEVVVVGFQPRRRVCYGMSLGLDYYMQKPDPNTKLIQIKAFPNPLPLNQNLNINFSNAASGTYQILLLNSSGQIFYSFQKRISSSNETEQIHLNEKMSAGVYLLQILDEKKQLIQTSKIVVR